MHGSLLPKYRGAAPVQWAILHGDAETGNTVIQMTPGLDAGPCLAQERTPIDPDEDAATLETRLAALGATLVLRVVDELAKGTAKPIEQNSGEASKAPRLTKEHGAIDWTRSSLEIKNLVRGVRPWPRAYTFWHRAAGPPMRLNIDGVQLVGPAMWPRKEARLWTLRTDCWSPLVMEFWKSSLSRLLESGRCRPPNSCVAIVFRWAIAWGGSKSPSRQRRAAR